MSNNVFQLNEVQQRVVGEIYNHVNFLNRKYVIHDRADSQQVRGEIPRGKVAIQLVMPCGTGKTEVIAALLNDDPSRYGVAIPYGAPQKIGFETDAVVLVVTPGNGGLDEQLSDRLRARLTDPSRVFHVREGKPMPLNALKGKVIVSSYDSLVKRRKLVEDDKKTPILDANGEQAWEYINKASREDERANFWSVVKHAKTRKLTVYVIIDEAHWGTGHSATSIGRFFDQIEDTLGYIPFRIEATATPKSVSSIPGERLRRVEAKESDFTDRDILLRQKVVVNPDRKQLIGTSNDAVEDIRKQLHDNGVNVSGGVWHHVIMADMALQKYRIIQKVAQAHPQKYNPLTLVCVNNDMDKSVRRSNGGKTRTDEMEQLIAYYAAEGITVENGKLAIWLDDDPLKLTRDEKRRLSDLNSKVEVLIFKQSVALGWDCPRAQFLLMVRKPSVASETFTPQLIGRIKRQPYGTVKGVDPRKVDPLDIAYIYPAQSELLPSKESLESMERRSSDESSKSDSVDKPHGAFEDQYDVWKALKPLKDHAKRCGRTSVGSDEFEKAVADIHLESLTYSSDDARTEVIDGADVKLKDDYNYEKVVANATDTFDTSGDPARDIGPKLTSMYKSHGLKLSGRHSDKSKGVIYSKVREFLEKDGETHSDREVWATALANVADTEGDFAELLQKLVKVAQDGERGHENKWTRRGAEVYMPAIARSADKAHKTDVYTKPLSGTHLYGHTVFNDTAKGPTASETKFENEVLSEILNEHIVSWLRNSFLIDGDAKSYCVPFSPPGEPDVVRESFPDYVAVLTRDDGTNFLFAAEVKGSGDGHDGGDPAIVAAKAEEMARITARTDDGWENTVAAVVYHNGVTWVVNEGPGKDGSGFKTVPLVPWLKRQGVTVK